MWVCVTGVHGGVGNHHCKSTRVSVIVCGCVQKCGVEYENREFGNNGHFEKIAKLSRKRMQIRLLFFIMHIL